MKDIKCVCNSDDFIVLSSKNDGLEDIADYAEIWQCSNCGRLFLVRYIIISMEELFTQSEVKSMLTPIKEGIKHEKNRNLL